MGNVPDTGWSDPLTFLSAIGSGLPEGMAPNHTNRWAGAMNNFSFEIKAIVPQPVPVTSVDVTAGTTISGGLLELQFSDNLDLAIGQDEGLIDAVTEFEVEGVSPTASPSFLEVTLEGAVLARKDVEQSIELFDYAAGQWELVDLRVAAVGGDSTVSVEPDGDLARFVEPETFKVEARICYQTLVPVKALISRTDQFFWRIGE
jgi:hypothetical protein